MDYEEKYKDLVKRLNKAREEKGVYTFNSVLDAVAPELKESEDERIRKQLLNWFKGCHWDSIDDGTLKRDDIIAWLEKQDQASDQIHYWTEEEIEPIISDYLRGAEHYGGMIGRLRCLKPKSLEKQGEQKTADKVEPKFKVGDVVTNKKSKDTVKIVQILHDSYCYSGWDGAATVHSDFSISEQDDWELVELTAWSEEGCQKYSEDDITTEEKDRTEYKKGFECGKQRVLKYPEDFGLCKKPAAKVEQKGMNIVEEDMTPFQKKVFCIIDTTIEEEQGLKQVCDELLALASNEIKQKPAWSEEDEEMLNQVIEDIVKFAGPRVCYHKDVDWLKSLKERYTWKPSDEQMEALEHFIVYHNGSTNYAKDLEELRLQLKKLREE